MSFPNCQCIENDKLRHANVYDFEVLRNPNSFIVNFYIFLGQRLIYNRYQNTSFGNLCLFFLPRTES